MSTRVITRWFFSSMLVMVLPGQVTAQKADVVSLADPVPPAQSQPVQQASKALPIPASWTAETAGQHKYAAAWELRLLGVDTLEKLAHLRAISDRRTLSLGVVGTSGVSGSSLAGKLGKNVTVEYRMGPNSPNCDPQSNTHDTQQLAVALDIINALGVKLKVLSYQAPNTIAGFTEAFAQAGRDADIVVMYQSVWNNIEPIVQSIRDSEKALFISPYVETGPSTNRTHQGYAHRPWGKGIDHFVTVVPLARKTPSGALCSVQRRDANDTEVINFIVPSFYASGTGGTCPSASVAVAVACYIYAACPVQPTPPEVISLMRRTSKVDEQLISSTPPFSRATVATLKKTIQDYVEPQAGHERRLDAPGILNLYDAYLQIEEGWPRRP